MKSLNHFTFTCTFSTCCTKSKLKFGCVFGVCFGWGKKKGNKNKRGDTKRREWLSWIWRKNVRHQTKRNMKDQDLRYGSQSEANKIGENEIKKVYQLLVVVEAYSLSTLTLITWRWWWLRLSHHFNKKDISNKESKWFYLREIEKENEWKWISQSVSQWINEWDTRIL